MSRQASDRSLSDSLISLNDTLNKDEGIVNTSSSHRFLNQPEDIDAKYTEYARTHLIQPDVDNFIEELIESLQDPEENRSVPGYIVGPYGYGKTSSAGKVWHELEYEHNYIATPPIYFRDLQSIVDAVYGWMRFRLQDKEDQLDELERCYEANATDNLEDLVESADLSNKDETKNDLQKLAEAGKVDIEFSVSNVLEFLSECNQIAKDAGNDGLVVIADELQQFVSNHNSDKEAYADLRDIAKSIALGLNEGDGLSLIFTMDEGLHSDLDINADDVLARLSEQNVTLNLSNVYGRDFPLKLWDDLSEKFEFYDRRHDIITEDALDAIGQICERGSPLSNGPRTVVDLFTIAIDHYLSEEEAFDALDLAESYRSGVVRYKGDKIKSAITQALNTDIVTTEDQEDFIKLCGVFPRGVSDERLKQYGLYEAKEEVKQELHGQLIMTQEEGRTLKRLKRDDEETGLKDEIFTQFYRKYDTTPIYDENAAKVFRDQVLTEELFPSTRGRSLNSWVTEHDFEPETGDAYAAVFRGSFNGQKYPKRIVEIRTGPSGDVVEEVSAHSNVDLHFGFVLNMDEVPNFTPQITHPKADEANLYLDFRDSFDTLPSNIALLEDYMSPDDVNPHLLLSLYKYIEMWQAERTINPNQEEQLNYIQNQLINQSIQKLFGSPLNEDELIASEGNGRRTIEAGQVVQKVFDILVEDVYDDYETLFISDNYDSFLESYEAMLTGNEPDLRISQKRGNMPIEGTKSEIANTIGVSSNSTAKTRLEKQYASLAEIEVWSGNDARIQLTLHPLEKLLKNKLEAQDDETLTFEEAYKIGSKKGHRSEEVDWALRLLEARDYIDRYPEEAYFELSEVAVDYHEVKEKHESLVDEAQKVNTIAEEWADYQVIESGLENAAQKIEDASEEEIEALDEILAELSDIENHIEKKKERLQVKYNERCESQKSDLQDLASATKPANLKTEIEGAKVPFEMHLGDIQVHLETRFKNLTDKAEEAEEKLRTEIEEASGPASLASIEKLQTALNEAEKDEREIESSLKEIEDDAKNYNKWCKLAQEMGDTRTKMVRYTDNHGDPDRVEGLLAELDDELSEIQKLFQQDSESALTDIEVKRKHFQQIKDRFTDITEGDRQDFTYRKRVLENTVRQATDGHGTIRQNLDPEDPQGSRDDLKFEFKRQITEEQGGLEDIQSEIESVRSSLDYAEMLQQVPDETSQTPGDIKRELDDIEDTLEKVDRAIDEMVLKDDIPLPADRPDNFPQTEKTLQIVVEDEMRGVGEFLSNKRTRVEDLDEAVGRWRSTTEKPPEKYDYLMEELDYRKERDLETVLVKIADKEGSNPRLEEVLDDLKELFEDNHITVQLRSEHRQ